MARDVLLIGSVPLSPAREVFKIVAERLGGWIRRIPDGEQIGWSQAVRRTLKTHPDFEPGGQTALNASGRDLIDLFKVRPGVDPDKIVLGPYGYADNARSSYAAFKELKDAGLIDPQTRFQATLPGPGTSAFFVRLPPEILLPMAREALFREVQAIVETVPANELTIQIDVAMEAEHEEWLRRPAAFDQPVHKTFHWSLDQMSESAAWLANRVPAGVELGFHICSIWHHDPAAGQDNAVLADITNNVIRKVTRNVDYVHVPLIPAHGEDDIAKLSALQLSPATTLFLGLINLADGLAGAATRMDIARRYFSNFGVAAFCGLGRPATTLAKGPSTHALAPIPELTRATPQTIAAVLDLHKQVAEL